MARLTAVQRLARKMLEDWEALWSCAKAQARPPHYNQSPKVTLTNPIALTSPAMGGRSTRN